VVERTLAWLSRFRCLALRYERRADIHEAFTTLGCALICLNQIRRFGNKIQASSPASGVGITRLHRT
jgi:hypothetical protein